MANILRPLNIQYPAQALGESASALGAYEQLRGIQEARVARESQARQQALITQLKGLAAFGPPEQRSAAMQQLGLIDADSAIGLQQRQTKAAQGAANLRTTQDELRKTDLRLANTNMVRRAVDAFQNRPEIYPVVRRALIDRGLVPEEALPETYPNNTELSEIQQSLEASELMVRDPQVAEKLSGVAAQAEQAYGRGTPEYQRVVGDAINAEIDKNRAMAEKARRPPQPRGPLIQFGGGVERGTAARMQLDIVNNKEVLRRLDSLSEMDPYIDDIATLQGGLKTFVGKGLDQIGLLKNFPGMREQVINARKLNTRVGLVFQPIKVALTGAAAPEKEMNDLKDILINSDLGPEEMRAALGELRRMAEDAVAVRLDVLNRGINPGDDGYGDAVEAAWSARRGAHNAADAVYEVGLKSRRAGVETAPTPGQPVRSALPQSPMSDARAARQDIDQFNMELESRQANAPQRAAPQQQAPKRRGGATGVSAQGTPFSSLTRQQQDEVFQTFEAMGGDKSALDELLRRGTIDQAFYDMVLRGGQ